MMTREEALRRFKAAKQKKMNAVAALEEKMKQAYEERTGMKAIIDEFFIENNTTLLYNCSE